MKRHFLPAIVVAAALVLAAIALALVGRDPLAVARALLEGSLLSRDGLEATLKRLVPLLLCSLAVTLAFRAGAWNLGAEGQLAIGALAAAWVGTGPLARALPESQALGVLALVAAALAGAGLAAIAAWLRERRGVPDVLATIFLNIVALGVVAWAVDEGGPLREHAGGYPRSDEVAPGAELPWFRALWFARFHLGLPLALALAALVELFLTHTRLGLGLRAAGARREAARAAGFRPGALVALAYVAGGALAGLGGGVVVTAVTHRLFRNVSGGVGYTAIAAALLGGLRPGRVVLASLLFAALEAGTLAAQGRAGASSAISDAIEGALLIIVIGARPLSAMLAERREARA
jgi:simple sugar transport system permease protein